MATASNIPDGESLGKYFPIESLSKCLKGGNLRTKKKREAAVRGEESERKFTILIGNTQHCSCGVTLCAHYLFVMLKVLKVSETSPLSWQTSLIDSEVDSILEGVNLAGERGKSPTKSGGAAKEFLRRGCGRTSAGGTRTGDRSSAQGLTERKEMKRLEIAPGDICPVCQEDIREIDEEGTSRQGLRAGQLTFCRDGCGNNLHTRCMLMYAEHRRSSGEKVCCPLCRIDWSTASVRALRKAGSSCGNRVSNSHQAKNLYLQNQDQEKNQNQNENQNQNRQQPADLVGHQGIHGTARPVPITCRACKIKIRAIFYRCLLCQPPGSWDLCVRCFTGVRATSRRGPCKITGRRRHPFVQGEASTFPLDWKPARSPDPREALSNRRAAADVMRSLQGREITTGDFELLLSLDASSTPPLHEHLLRALPVYGDSISEGEIESTMMEAREHALPSGRLALFESAASGSSELTPQAMRSTAEETCSEVGSSYSNTPHRAANRAWDQVMRGTIASSSHQSAPLALSELTSAPDPGVAPPGRTCCYCSPLETRFENSGKADTTVEGSRRLLRRLPCGHYAHDACLIPSLLEGLGRSDPALCSCPIDGSTVFPALERRLVLASNSSNRRRQASARRSIANPDEHRSMSEETVGPRSDVSETGVIRSSSVVTDSAANSLGEASACGKVKHEDMKDLRMMLIGEGLRKSGHACDPLTENPITDRDRCGGRNDRRIRARRRQSGTIPKISRDSETIGVTREEGGDGVGNGAGEADDRDCNDIEGTLVQGRGMSSDLAGANAIRRGQVRGRRSSCERDRPRRFHEEVGQKTPHAGATPTSEVRDNNGAVTMGDDELSSLLTSSKLMSKKSNRRVPTHRTTSDDALLASPGAKDRIRTPSAI